LDESGLAHIKPGSSNKKRQEYMMRYHRMWLIGLLVALMLSACGGAGSPPMATKATPEMVMQQMLTALDQQDIVTLQKLLDPQMPYRDVSITNGLRLWRERRRDYKQYRRENALGPAVKTTIQPTEQRGETTMIRALIDHEYGVSDLTLMLRPTADGYQVANWESLVVKSSP
jgi:hypothetical protein